MPPPLLYLDALSVRALLPPAGRLRESLARAYACHAGGGFVAPPKQTLTLGPGHFFQSLSVTPRDGVHAVSKWIGVAAGNTQQGLANVNGLLLVSDARTGVPLAIMDAGVATVARTAAMSALAAQYLARADSRTLGFIGCGQQARGHLEAFAELFSRLESVVAYSRSERDAQVLADLAGVSSVPAGPSLVPFLDARRVARGAFVTAVDLGRSWVADSLGLFDLKCTDDCVQAMDDDNRKKLAYPGPFATDLAGLVTGAAPRRTSAEERSLFLFPGHALGDFVVATEVYCRAMAGGQGVPLPH